MLEVENRVAECKGKQNEEDRKEPRHQLGLSGITDQDLGGTHPTNASNDDKHHKEVNYKIILNASLFQNEEVHKYLNRPDVLGRQVHLATKET